MRLPDPTRVGRDHRARSWLRQRRDCYVLSQLVGPGGQVIRVDMTGEQLAVARRHLDFHAQRFG
jgi:hypothetical protein